MFENHYLMTVFPEIFVSQQKQKVMVFVLYTMMRLVVAWSHHLRGSGCPRPSSIVLARAAHYNPFTALQQGDASLEKLTPVQEKIYINVHRGIVSNNEKSAFTRTTIHREEWINCGVFVHWKSIGIPFTVKMNYLKLYVSTQRNLKDILRKKTTGCRRIIQFDNVYSMLTNMGYVCGMFTSSKIIILLYIGNGAIVSPEERWQEERDNGCVPIGFTNFIS